jgi:hypothetical protein
VAASYTKTARLIERQARREGEVLARVLRMCGKRPLYYYIRTKAELELMAQLFYDSNYRYLHISCHGGKSSLSTTRSRVETAGDSVRRAHPFLQERQGWKVVSWCHRQLTFGQAHCRCPVLKTSISSQKQLAKAVQLGVCVYGAVERHGRSLQGFAFHSVASMSPFSSLSFKPSSV